MPNRKLLSAAVLAASITGGGAVGVVLGAPALTAAQESDGAETTTTTEAPEAEADTDATDAEDCEGRGPGAEGRGFGHRFVDSAVAAEALGLTEEELRDAVDADTSIADLAAEKGVDVQTIIDALVADATADIDEAVAAGDLDAERAATLKEDLTERVTAFVEGTRPEGGPRGGFGPRGEHKRGADDSTTDDTTTESESDAGS